MRKLNRLTEVLAVAALVLLGHPDTLKAQTLTFSPSPLEFTIPGPGSNAGPSTVIASSTGVPVNTVCPCSINTTSGGNWLSSSGSSAGNSFTVSIANTSSLTPNTNYVGSIFVNANDNASGNLQVILHVGGSSTGGGGLLANPASVAFTQSAPGSGSSQNVSLSFNGSFVPVTSFNFTPSSSGLTFVNIQNLNGTIILTVNNVASTAGFYTGTLTIGSQNFGSVNVPVSLSVGGVNPGLSVSPSQLSFNVQVGGSAPSQNVNVTSNGTPITINTLTTTSTPLGWLLPSISGTGVVNVGVNAAGLSTGTYTGTVAVSTGQGPLSFQVNLTVGGIPSLQVNPTTLNFAYQAGTAFPLAQTITVTSSGNPVNFSVTPSVTSGGGQWLVVSPSGGSAVTPSAITVSVNPTSLASGFTYVGNIRLDTFGATSNSTINIPVNLLVSNNPILSANPAGLSFTAQVGANPPAQTLALGSSSTALSYTLSSAVVTPNGGAWLQVPTQAGATPGSVSVSVNTQGLAVGTYTGNVNVSSPTAGNASITVPITLTVTSGSILQLSPTSLNFAYQTTQSQPPLNQSVTVSTSGGQLGFSVSAQVNSGPQGWLVVSPPTGTAPGNFIVGVNTVGLTPATYTGTVNVTPSGSTAVQTIQVTLVVSNTTLFLVSPGGITFTAPQGSASASPAFQQVAVTSTDGTAITYGAIATVSNPGQNWLLVSQPTGASPSNLTITANPSGLAVGTYTGSVAITGTSPTNIANSPQNVAVTLNVTPTATLSVLPSNSLSFIQSTSGAAPASQTLTVNGSSGTLTFNAAATTTAGGTWLTVNPLSASTPGTLTVSVNGSGLLAGTYSGSILITSPGAANSLTVNVTLTISNAPTIVVSPIGLSAVNYQVGSANPPTQTISVTNQNGAAVSFTSTVTMLNGTGWLAASPTSGTTPGNVTVTISPAGLTAGTYTGSVAIAIAGATNTPLSLPITLVVTPAPVILPSIASVQNAASYAFSAISPGLNVYIQGSNMGPGTLVPYHVGANGTLDSTVAETTVTFDGIPAPIIYTSSTQVSVMVPYGVAGRGRVNMVITYKGVASAPFPINVSDVAPGLYTLNANSTGAGSGVGQGAILNENSTVNSPSNTEQVNHFIQIYATGEGLTIPRGVDGAINPSRLPLPAPALPVTVTIGGVPIPASDIIYAGSAPGSVQGQLQVNARIPANLTAGPQPVFITVGGVPSQAGVIVQVRR